MRTQATGQLNKQPPWYRRLVLPAYHVKDAARYARVSPQTILNWQKKQTDQPTISHREDGQSLSYLQLIEVAVVAAMREAGVSLTAIRNAKEYIAQRLKSEYPFAQYGFKTDGKQILMKLSDFEKNESPDKLIVVSKSGQLGWNTILEARLKEFEYNKGMAVRWNVGGADSPVSIDPQVSFGAPSVKGIPTWTIKGRLDAGESIDDIADDFILDPAEVREALRFEGIEVDKIKNNTEWSH
ncbi:DUF433 domain-containing protein [Noviherbaspirillum sp. Root189]|uniref:DUF433 domain-containing protein n=1 Tax=Noviherbaspirillum sp. Root189 TaxID=1736487 RepID=UPI00070B8278|nr:DUF433 domain-containing protein [Noviherbaspirillum sp. Root189]KRB73485.1 hypothetical protein ASE07_06430 [Noviherbaspirillum sp. Root189]